MTAKVRDKKRTLLFAGAMVLCSLASSGVKAQMPNLNLIPELQSKTPEEKERDERTQKAYRDSLRKIPDSKAANDPWGSVRSNDAPKPSSRTKHGGIPN